MSTITLILIGVAAIAIQCNIDKVYDKIEKLNDTIDELKKHLISK